MANKKEFTDKRADILEIARKYGVDKNYFFMTTFERYEMQLEILTGLAEAIKGDDLLVTKEYVKGRENVYTHPAIGEYNKTASAANQTVTTLVKIITSFKAPDTDDEDEEFFK